MELIDREEVLSKKVYTETEEGWSGYTVDVKDIEQLPTVQVVPIDVLDKIRAEIDSHCSDNRDRNDGLYIAMKIIDKYRESKDADSN